MLEVTFWYLLTYVTRAILSHEFATLPAKKSQMLRLSSCTLLRLCRKKTNTASVPLFPFHDPPSQTQFQNDEIVPYLIFSELFDYSHAIILQASLLKPKYW